MTTTTIYPTADNTVKRTSANSTWTSLATGNGTGVGGPTWSWDWAIRIDVGSTTDRWDTIHRAIFVFDTSSIPDTDVISSATLSIDGYSKTDPATAITPDANIYTSGASGTDTQILAGDYQLVGSTALSTAITYAGWSTSYNDFALNATGIAAIDKTGYTRLCLRNENYDASDVAPFWSFTTTHHDLNANMSEAVGTGQDPKLVVIHAPAPASTFVPRTIIT